MIKLSKAEKSWILYDVANSAFILLATTILPIVFNGIAEAHLDSATYLAYWGYGVSAATIITAVLGPLLGTISDRKGKMPFFRAFLVLGIVSLLALAFVNHYMSFLILVVLAKTGFNGANVFYDSMLVDVSHHDHRDLVSSYGFAWGYIGSTIPFVISIAIIGLAGKIGISPKIATSLSFLLTALWWGGFSLPILRDYKQRYFYEGDSSLGNMLMDSFAHLAETFREILKNKEVLVFLIAFFFYIDGVSTIINMATAYGTSLGLSTMGLVLALLMTQLVAFPATIVFARASKTVDTFKLLNICILAYTLITLYAVQLDSLAEFWVLAFAVGLFQGGVQSLSRSHFSKIIPQDKSGRYFGIYDIFGKGASFFGTLTVSLISQITGKQNLGITALVVFFVIGLVLFNYSLREEKA